MKIKVKTIIMVIILLYFFEPRSILELNAFSFLNTIYQIMRYISYGFIILIILLNLKSFRFSKIILNIAIYYIILIFSCYMNGNVVNLYAHFDLVIMCIFTEIIIKSKYKIPYFQAMFIITSILIFINFATLLIYPETMYIDSRNWSYNWFLGYKNSQIYTFLPCLFSGITLSIIKQEKIGKEVYILTLIILISCILNESSTSLVSMIFVSLFILLNSKNKNIFSRVFKKTVSKLSGVHYLIGIVILSYAIVIGRIQNYFSFLIEDLLHKDLSFTTRTLIWDETINYIKESFWFGYGLESPEISEVKIFQAQAHNKFLDVFYTGGLLGFVFFIRILWITSKKLYKNKGYILTKYYTAILAGYFIVFFQEGARAPVMFFVFLIIVNNVEKLVPKKDIELSEVA